MSAKIAVHRSNIPSATIADYDMKLSVWRDQLQEIEDKHGRIVGIIPRAGTPLEYLVITRGDGDGG